jgi:hypothetical protein
MASERDTVGEPPPHRRLVAMTRAYYLAPMIHAAAALDLPDLIGDGAKTAEELARAGGVHAPLLYRLLRTLAGEGLFSEDESRRFALTPLGAALRAGAPGGARDTILFTAGDHHWRAWGELLAILKDGQPGIEKVYGQTFFEYLAERPEEARQFNTAMIGIHGEEAPLIADGYDFSAFGTIVDVGGGTGNLLATILERCPKVRGLLYDQKPVVAEARALIAARGLTDRMRVEAGSFFERVPEGGDAYILSHIVHDWPEERCLALLAACRKVMTAKAKLLIIETVIPPGNDPHVGKLQDVTMMVFTGGQERTEREHAALLEKAGFRLARVVPTAASASVVEAVRA